MESLSIEQINKLQEENEAYKQSEQEASEIIAELKQKNKQLREALSDCLTLFRLGIKIINCGSKDSAAMEAVKNFTIKNAAEILNENSEIQELEKSVQQWKAKSEIYRLALKDINAYCAKNTKYYTKYGYTEPTTKTRFLSPIMNILSKFSYKEFE